MIDWVILSVCALPALLLLVACYGSVFSKMKKSEPKVAVSRSNDEWIDLGYAMTGQTLSHRSEHEIRMEPKEHLRFAKRTYR